MKTAHLFSQARRWASRVALGASLLTLVAFASVPPAAQAAPMIDIATLLNPDGSLNTGTDRGAP